jgi:hypothetical protein
MFFGSVSRTKTQGLRYLGAGGREAGIFDGFPDQSEDLLLSGGEFIHWQPLGRWLYPQPVFLYSTRNFASFLCREAG